MLAPTAFRLATSLVAVAAALAACSRAKPQEQSSAKPDLAEAALFAPLPAVMESPGNPRTPEKVALGRMLYYDTRFSKDGSVSCYVCHPLHDYGVSHRAKGVGHSHLEGDRNEPTVYNSAEGIAQFWDGRSPDVEAQALGPVLNPHEMGLANDADVISRIRKIPGYVEAFKRAFPGEADPVTFKNFGLAVGAFERGLVTPSRFDKYLEGDNDALTVAEKDGLRTFVSAGCAQCHNGRLVGGKVFQRLGVKQPWPSQKDIGREAVTGKTADRMVFKVPSLRNIEQTWPYFHDGSVRRLDDAIAMMGQYQIGRNLNDTQVASIRTFLESLTGTVPFDYIDEPVLPPDRGQKGVALLR